MTFDGTSVTLAGRLINSYTSLASSPAKVFTGTWFTGGTSTTTKPHFLIEPSGATSTAWSTSGTGLGVNAASGFAGRLLDLQVNGTSRTIVQGDGKFFIGATSGTAWGELANIAGRLLVSDGSQAIGLSSAAVFINGSTNNFQNGQYAYVDTSNNFSIVARISNADTEGLRITNDRVIAYNQPAPTSKSTAATLTIAELKTRIVQYTGSANTLTLPTGTLMEGGFSGIYTNMTFEWSVINTGSGTCTIGAGTDHTIVGGGTVAAGASGRFASRRTAANTFVTYRLS
jgi:hypothetical protein